MDKLPLTLVIFGASGDLTARKLIPSLYCLARKGRLPAFRDAALFKAAYAFGLRRNEARMLDVVDFGRNPKGPEFGEYGVVYVRHGKAMKGSPPKRRSVLTIWPWSVEILQQWLEEVRPLFPHRQRRQRLPICSRPRKSRSSSV